MNFRPETWLDILAYAIVGIPATVAAVGVILARKSQRENHDDQVENVAQAAKVADAVLLEVTNDHGTNLRDDIDGLAAAIKGGFHEIRQDIQGLRAEVRTERVERIEGDRRGIQLSRSRPRQEQPEEP